MPDGYDAPYKCDPDELIAQCDAAFENSRLFRNTWERARQLFLPDQAPFNVGDAVTLKGQRDRETTVDTYPQYAARVHATFLFGSIINGDDDWFKITCHSRARPKLAVKDSGVLAWADDYRGALADIVMDEETGFIEQYFAMLKERTVFGNGRLYGGDRPGALPIVRCSPMRDSAWQGGAGHTPDTNWWRQSLSAAEWAKKFPQKYLGEAVTKASQSKQNRDEPFTFIHGVMENPGWHPMQVDERPQQRRYLAVWLNERERILVSENWLTSNPYEAFRCPRRASEHYGRGPADEAMEESNMVQRVRVGVIRGIEKTVDPLLLLPDDGVMTPPTNEAQGAMVIKSELMMRGGDPVRYLKSEARPDIGQEFLRDNCYASIDRAFSRDLMTLPREPRMLDSQIVGLQEEQSRGVVPLIAPLFAPTARFLGRIADIAQRQGRLPMPPAEARGMVIAIEFRNPLERAARLAEVRAFMQALQILAQAANIDPGARHALRVVEGVQYCARILGVPEKLISTEDQVKQLLAGDAQAMQQKGQMETALDASTAVKNAGAGASGLADAAATAQGAPAAANAA